MKTSQKYWWLGLLGGIIGIIVGYFITTNPMEGAFTVTIWIGLGFLLLGIVNVILSFSMSKVGKVIESWYKDINFHLIPEVVVQFYWIEPWWIWIYKRMVISKQSLFSQKGLDITISNLNIPLLGVFKFIQNTEFYIIINL